MKELGKRAAPKKGLSPTVILLGVFALIILILCVSLTPKSKQENEGSTSDVEQTPQNGPSSENAPSREDNSPALPNNVITKDARLTIEEKILNFPSGGCVSYGYPILQLKDNALADTINATLHNLVDTVILPKANELYNEDAPGSKRHYDYRLTVSDKYYSVIVTVDIQEGITSDLQAFSWNFSKEDGKIFDLYTDCKDRYSLAKLIDSHIKNNSSFDPLIHSWIEEALVSEAISQQISFYFTNDMFVVVINKRFRLNSPNRNPILIEVPYEEVEPLFDPQ